MNGFKLHPKGFILIGLLVAMVVISILMIGLSAIKSAKQYSEVNYVQSTRAYYLAQAGIEWAIRNSTDNMTAFFANPGNLFPRTKAFGNGSFTVNYNNNTLTSAGTVGSGSRSIILSNFVAYVVGDGITLIPGNPPYQDSGGGAQKHAVFPLLNNYRYNIYFFRVDLAKEGPHTPKLNDLYMGGVHVWNGDKIDVSDDHTSPTAFPFNQASYYAISPGALQGSFIDVQATSEVSGTWYVTLHYSKQTNLSNPKTVTLIFVIP